MFYAFWQNNSGGSYIADGTVEQLVIVEADNAGAANEFACIVGVYFGGVRKGIDCDCCGDRWYSVTEDDAYTVPALADRPVKQFFTTRNNKVNTVIYYKDGTKAYGVKPSWDEPREDNI